ncbi:MAG: ABC transporter ATP-binding protein [Lentisphaeria bacterium]|nr:ABC transporter ATP-binding protein [Lentisphaeria bacterium]
MDLFKRFLHYYRPYRWLFIADMICVIIASAIDLLFPQLLNLLTKDVFHRGPEAIMKVIVWVGLGLLGLYLVRYFCMYFTTCWGHVMGARMETDMRRDLFHHYQRLSFSYYDKNNTGEMMSRIVSDLFDITELCHHGPEMLLISSIKIIGSFAILLTINWKMTLILLAVTLCIIVFSAFQRKKMRDVFADNRKKIAVVNSRIQDSLSGIRVVKSFANEKIEIKKFEGTNEAFLESKRSSYRVMGMFHATNNFMQGFLYIAILISGGYFIAKGTLEPTELAVYALYIGLFLGPVDMLLHFTEAFQRGFSGFRRFAEILNQIPDIRDNPGAKDLPPTKGHVVYQGVGFSYEQGKEVLHDISFEIRPGTTVALAGASGGGKSTICSLLSRFYEVKEGSVSIDGYDIRDLKLESLRRQIGIVQQDVYIFNGTVRENILYGKPDATEEELILAAKRADIHDFILSLPDGYDSELGERGVRLSGGQKQRLSIARVFLKNPPILILDEATSSLDNESERKIQAAITELSKGRTVLVIAHRLSTIKNADEIIMIEDGKIAERGTHDSLVAQNGVYAKYHALTT